MGRGHCRRRRWRKWSARRRAGVEAGSSRCPSHSHCCCSQGCSRSNRSKIRRSVVIVALFLYPSKNEVLADANCIVLPLCNISCLFAFSFHLRINLSLKSSSLGKTKKKLANFYGLVFFSKVRNWTKNIQRIVYMDMMSRILFENEKSTEKDAPSAPGSHGQDLCFPIIRTSKNSINPS